MIRTDFFLKNNGAANIVKKQQKQQLVFYISYWGVFSK